jgi:putative protein-disulfide isomerase
MITIRPASSRPPAGRQAGAEAQRNDMQPTLIYCYDAYCGWCFGFSPVIRQIAREFRDRMDTETLSGGMIPESPRQPIATIAPYIQGAYKNVEELTGIRFGEDFLWHINNPDRSDWFLDSEIPARAMCVFKDYHPDETIAFAGDLQHALHVEGRDLTDDEAYRHLLDRWGIPAKEFYTKLHDPAYADKARYEFNLCRQLQVNGFPAVLLQTGDLKFYLLSKGYTDHDTLKARLDKVLEEIAREQAPAG